MIYIVLGVIGGLVFLGLVALIVVLLVTRKKAAPPQVELEGKDIKVLVDFVQAQKSHDEEKQKVSELKKADQKQKLEVFKQTKEQLREKLARQIDAKQWRPLESVLKSADKGGTGIYILFNETKGKYYVGQAKQLYKRVRDHFYVEDIAKDFLAGDKIQAKFLTANELDADYRLDHIEKTGIEIFAADKSGYNKTKGNL